MLSQRKWLIMRKLLCCNTCQLSRKDDDREDDSNKYSLSLCDIFGLHCHIMFSLLTVYLQTIMFNAKELDIFYLCNFLSNV
jgi:hypothetical protein